MEFHIIVDTRFGEDESLLSFGQRQLFCLARAVLKGSICLVLDEATSNLDSETEKQFLQCSTNAFKGKTLITIAVRSEWMPLTATIIINAFIFYNSILIPSTVCTLYSITTES